MSRRRFIHEEEYHPLLKEFIGVSGPDEKPAAVVEEAKKKKAAAVPVWIIVLVGVAICGFVAAAIATSVIVGSSDSEPPTPAPTIGDTPAPTFNDQPSNIDSITLALVCNRRFVNGTCRAFFSYQKETPGTFTVPVGVNNYVEPGSPNRGQLTRFASGLHYGANSFLWDCSRHEYARLTVQSSVAVAPAHAVACPSLTTLARLGPQALTV